MTQPPPMLRPLAVGEIIDAGIRIYRRNWRVLFAISATIVIPLNILSFGLALIAAREVDNLPTLDTADVVDIDFSAFYTWIGVALLTGLVSFLALLIVNAATLRAVADGYLGLTPDRKESLSLAIKRLGALVGVTLLQVLAIGLVFAIPIVLIAIGGNGGVLLGIAAVLAGLIVALWLGISWTAAIPAIMVERTGPAEALGRSMRLVSGRWWPVFGVVILVAIIRSVIGAVAGIGSGAIFFAAPDNFVLTATVDTLQSTLVDIVLLPFAASITAVLYFDLRVRKEGFDLELLARSIGSGWSRPTAEQQPGNWTAPTETPPANPERWSARPPLPPQDNVLPPQPPGAEPWDAGPPGTG